MQNYVTPKEASKYFNVSDQALRSWANEGRIQCIKTEGGHRRYLLKTEERKPSECVKIIYSRVSSKKQQADLERQTEFLRDRYPEYKVISDIGSGINFSRAGFKRILEGVFQGNIKEVVVAKRDRFTRFGYSLFEWIFEQHGAQLLCVQEEDETPTNDLAEDLMAIITVFSAKYYGKRKYRKQTHTDL